MKSSTKVFIPIFACLLALTGCKSRGGGSGAGGSSQGGGGSSLTDRSYVNINFDTTSWGGYYADYAESLKAESGTLLFNLKKLCFNTHTTKIEYEQYWSYTKASTQPRSIDEYGEDSSKNIFFYTGKLASKSTSYSREHVWPCANSSQLWVHKDAAKEYIVDKSSNPHYWGGGSDLYHVRPATSSVNTARGNSKFIEFGPNDVYYETSENGGQYVLKTDDSDGSYARKCEPADQIKGDIARICMYVYVHYSAIGGSEWSWYYDDAKTKPVMGNLALRNVFGYENDEDIYNLIVKWNRLDPVDSTERLRNDTVQAIQGNRNPFVDYPELITNCFAE